MVVVLVYAWIASHTLVQMQFPEPNSSEAQVEPRLQRYNWHWTVKVNVPFPVSVRYVSSISIRYGAVRPQTSPPLSL